MNKKQILLIGLFLIFNFNQILSISRVIKPVLLTSWYAYCATIAGLGLHCSAQTYYSVLTPAQKSKFQEYFGLEKKCHAFQAKNQS